MARSASRGRALCALGLIVGAAGPLAGCTTTQTRAARLQLNSARLRASETPTRIGAPSAAVKVLGVAAVRETGGTAFVVDLANRGSRAVSDLPIRVGYRVAGRTAFLNAAAGADYFASHVPLVRAGSRLQWVLTSRRRVPPRSELVATVGAKPSVTAGGARNAPAVTAKLGTATAAGVARVSVTNTSGITQYSLPLYVVGDDGGHVVAAGETTLGDLGGGTTRDVKVRLLGAVGAGTAFSVEARPTIFK